MQLKKGRIRFFVCLMVLILVAGLISACSEPASAPTTPSPSTPAPSPPEQVEKVEIKFLLTSRGLRAGKGGGTIAVWADEVERISNGRIDVVELIAAVPPEQMFDATAAGAADIFDGGASWNPGRWPIMDMFNLVDPFTLCRQPSQAARDLLQRWPEMQQEFAPLKLLAINAAAPSPPGMGIGLTKKPAYSLADLKGLKIGTNRDWRTKRLTALGISPVGTSIFELYENLQKGIVDGEILDPEMFSSQSLSLGEVVKYFIPMGFDLGISFIGMNPESYNRFPPDVQKIIDDVSEEFPVWCDEYFATVGLSGLQDGKALGLEIIEFSPEEQAKCIEAMKPVQNEYISILNEKGYDGQAMFDEMLSVLKQYSGGLGSFNDFEY